MGAGASVVKAGLVDTDGTDLEVSGPLLWEGASIRDALHTFQRELILARLERHGGSVKAARESLGLTKTTFHHYMKDLGISAPTAPGASCCSGWGEDFRGDAMLLLGAFALYGDWQRCREAGQEHGDGWGESFSPAC